MGFYSWFRDKLGFGPLQGAREDGRQGVKGLAATLCSGLDDLGDRAGEILPEHYPISGSEAALRYHAQERSMPRLAGQTDDDHRRAVVTAELTHWQAGRRQGYRAAIEAATDKPYTITFYNPDCWHFGGPFGVAPMSAGDGSAMSVLIKFADQLDAEELASVQASVDRTGKAERDKIIYQTADQPLGWWRFGEPTFGLAPMYNGEEP